MELPEKERRRLARRHSDGWQVNAALLVLVATLSFWLTLWSML